MRQTTFITGADLLTTPPVQPDPDLARVTSRIGAAVLKFAAQKKRSGNPDFHMDELTEFVKAEACIAPDSAGRILRLLKAKGDVDYKLIDRSKSLYRILSVRT